MSEIPIVITEAQRTAGKLLIRGILQENDPALDISTGGVVDSLLVDGMALVGAGLSVTQNTLTVNQQLKAIAEGTVSVSDDVLDTLMQNYRVVRENASAAVGWLELVVQYNQVYTIYAGAEFVANGISYSPVTTYSIVPTTDTSTDLTIASNVRISQAYDSATGYLYRFQIQVRASVTGPEGVVISGQPFTMGQPLAGLGSVRAVTNFSGGTLRETNAQLVTRALSGLVPQSLSGVDSISAAAARAYPRARVACIGAGHSLMTRDSHNPLGISTGGMIDVYAKSGSVATAVIIPSAEVLNTGTRQLKIRLTRAQSAGVYSAQLLERFTTSPPTGVTGAITVTQISYTLANGVTGFIPVTATSAERFGSAITELEILFNDTRMVGVTPVVTLSTVGELVSGPYQVITSYQPGVYELDAAFRSNTLRPPGLDVMVRAALPVITAVQVVCQRPSGYSGRTSSALSAALSAAINDLAVGSGSLTTYGVGGLLQALEPTLNVTTVTLQGSVSGITGTGLSLTQSGQALTVPLDTSRGISPENTYFATTPSLTVVTLV